METGLYLEIEAGEGAAERLAAALDAGPVAAVLIHAPLGARTRASALQNLVAMAQRHGAAALLPDDLHRVRELSADGLHLTWTADVEARYAEARRTLGSQLSIGCMSGASRHDAMTLGEAGADYIGFGDVGMTATDRAELVAWWGELFEVPCVAFGVTGPAEASALGESGADFVGVRIEAGATSAAAGERVREIIAVLRAVAGRKLGQTARGRR